MVAPEIRARGGGQSRSRAPPPAPWGNRTLARAWARAASHFLVRVARAWRGHVLFPLDAEMCTTGRVCLRVLSVGVGAGRCGCPCACYTEARRPPRPPRRRRPARGAAAAGRAGPAGAE
eukprot:gene12667-biopygen15521